MRRNMLRRLPRATLALLLLVGAPLPAQEGARDTAPVLDAQTFAALRGLVLPSAEELAWKRHEWRASLWEGVIEAQELDKPILLWAMNGHPLGCT